MGGTLIGAVHLSCGGLQLFVGIHSLLTENTVMFFVESVIPGIVELCSAIWDPFSNEGFSGYCA